MLRFQIKQEVANVLKHAKLSEGNADGASDISENKDEAPPAKDKNRAEG